MAGNYMNAPAARLAYDRDGSIGVGINAVGTLTALSAVNLQSFNSEAEATVAPVPTAYKYAIIFPTPMDLKSVFIALGSSTPVAIETSKDTTTGVDGTWVTQVSAAAYLRDVKPNYRIATSLVTLPTGTANQSIRGIRFNASTTFPLIKVFHIYGDPASDATPDRLAAWHPTLDQALPPTQFDWGDVPRSSSADKTFRIKNLSATLTAHDIDVYTEALTPGVPSVAGMHTISDDGSIFLTAIAIASLAPGVISGVLTLRRTVPSNAQVSVWSARVAADVFNWT